MRNLGVQHRLGGAILGDDPPQPVLQFGQYKIVREMQVARIAEISDRIVPQPAEGGVQPVQPLFRLKNKPRARQVIGVVNLLPGGIIGHLDMHGHQPPVDGKAENALIIIMGTLRADGEIQQRAQMQVTKIAAQLVDVNSLEGGRKIEIRRLGLERDKACHLALVHHDRGAVHARSVAVHQGDIGRRMRQKPPQQVLVEHQIGLQKQNVAALRQGLHRQLQRDEIVGAGIVGIVHKAEGVARKTG